MIELRRDAPGAGAPARRRFDDVRRRLDELDGARAPSRSGTPPGWPTAVNARRSVVQFRDNGFVVRSPDDRFLLRPRLRLQTFYVR